MNTEICNIQSFSRGVTLIEALMVLGIMAILIGMVMVSYSLASQSMKTQQLISEALQLIQITQQLSDSKTTFAGMNSGVLVKTGLVPSRYVSGGNLVTPWGGEIEAIPYNYGHDNGPDIYLAFNFLNLPREACEKLGVMDFSGTAQSLTVTGMQDDDPSGLSPIKVITDCDNGNNNYVNIRIEH